jgi:hypothetical protein
VPGPVPGLDLIPARWLHLTTQGVGFTDEVSDDEVTALTSASAERLKGFTPQRMMLGPARVTPEAILLDVAPAAGLAGIRRQLREAIRDVLGAGRRPSAASASDSSMTVSAESASSRGTRCGMKAAKDPGALSG